MSKRLPPLNALRVFDAAARHLSFTRAADELFVTQAAVSHQIKKHLYHINHTGGLVMQVFYRKGFKLLAGFMAEQKSEKQKQRGDTHAGKKR